jgi:monoamine oxidase
VGGPLSECHDASLPNGPAALLGFLIPNAIERAALGESLTTRCLDQLARYFGPAAANPRETNFMDWSTEPLASTPRDVPLLEHPAYGLPAETRALWDGRLRFAGTETAPEHGGYMEGALEAAERAVRGGPYFCRRNKRISR